MFNKTFWSILFLPSFLWSAPTALSSPHSLCTVASALNVLIPGAQWTLANNDYSTFAFVGVSTFTAPTTAAVNAQITTCQANETANAGFVIEISTTAQVLQALYPVLNDGTATAQQQLQATAMSARIHVLRSLLGQ